MRNQMPAWMITSAVDLSLRRFTEGCMAAAFMLIALASPAPSLAQQTVIVPSDADRAAFQRGTAMQRVIDFLGDPKECGIVLLRARCLDDVNAFALSLAVPKSPEFDQIRTFAQTGNLDSYDAKWADINAVMLPEGLWKKDPRTAWLLEAGMVLESSYSVPGPMSAILQLPLYENIGRYGTAADPYGTLVPVGIASAAQAPPKHSTLAAKRVVMAALSVTQV